MFAYTKNRAGVDHRDGGDSPLNRLWRPWGGAEVTSTLGTSGWSTPCSDRFNPRKRPGTHLKENKEEKDIEL